MLILVFGYRLKENFDRVDLFEISQSKETPLDFNQYLGTESSKQTEFGERHCVKCIQIWMVFCPYFPLF